MLGRAMAWCEYVMIGVWRYLWAYIVASAYGMVQLPCGTHVCMGLIVTLTLRGLFKRLRASSAGRGQKQGPHL